MPKNTSQSTALSARDAVVGIAFATLAAVALIAVLAALAALAPRAEAARALFNLDHRFPVPSPHTYGDGYGAGRDHQGQDVFADCGKRVLAARKGRVQFRGRDAGAGNYLVVDGARTRVDYVYLHLRRQGMAGEGESVATGQRIGRVGQSGNASGCHLHFELWSQPGWYEGGHAKRSVTKHLRRWDRADG